MTMRAAEEVQPVGEHVEARERDVGRTDLQRHQGVGEAGEQWGGEEQQHDRAVHREQLVELLRVVDDLQAGAMSSARMTRASTPPNRKKTNEVTKYRFPMTLWSVVVNHCDTPVRAGATSC